jgi:hypothetical protein
MTTEKPQELQRYEPNGAVGNALSSSQITDALKQLRQVMAENMTEGQDYGKVPGCGDKPGLFQPGAQKLSMMFQLSPSVNNEVVTDYPNFHRGYRLIVRVQSGSKCADGVGECSTMETKYRFRNGGRKCPTCGKETILQTKQGPPGFFCWAKKGGCGAKFAINDKAITEQNTGRVEHDNPPDFWNTVRKMAFKRAFVHAIINATNTSELWSQDLEDLAANGVVSGGKVEHAADEEQQHSEPTPPPAAAKPTGKLSKQADSPEIFRDGMIKGLMKMFPQEQVKEYALKAGILLPTESLAEWPFRFLPRIVNDDGTLNLPETTAAIKDLKAKIKAFHDGQPAEKPITEPATSTAKVQPVKEPPAKSEPVDATVAADLELGWRKVICPIGKTTEGKRLCDLEPAALKFYAQDWFPEKSIKDFEKQPKAAKKLALEFRLALDAAAKENGWEITQ